MTDLEGAVERAESILKAWNRRETDLLEANNRYLERARAAEVERDAMREGLRPFSSKADRYQDSPLAAIHDNVQLWQLEGNPGMRVDITVGDLRRAAALVNGEIGG